MKLTRAPFEEESDHRPPSDRGVWAWPDRLTPWGGPAIFVLAAVLYGVGSRLALILIDMSGLQSVFFIPAGITVAFLIRLPRRSWWIVLVAAASAELTMDLAAGYSLSQVAGFAVANAIEPLAGASIVVATCRSLDLTRRRHLLWFTVGAVLVGPLVGAAIGAGAAATGPTGSFGVTLWQWLIGDALGVILVGGAILSWGSSPDRRSLFSSWGIGLLLSSVAGTFLVLNVTHLPLAFLVLIGVIVAGALFGTRAAATTSLAVATTIAIFFAFSSGDLLMGLSTASALIVIKLQLGTVALAGMLVAAEAHEREIALESVIVASAAAEAAKGERQRHHDLAVQVQRGLLPSRLIDRPGFDIAAQHRSAQEGLEIGGDWYDSIDLGAGRFGLVVGDVVGHGIEAMTAMGRLRTALVALAMHNENPAQVLEELDSFVRGPDGADYATVFYAILDSVSNTIEYASAGHPPALLLAPDGETSWLDRGQSSPLSAIPEHRRQGAVAELPPGATLVLYTDGLVERRGESLGVGLDRLKSMMPGLKELGAQEICDRLLSELAPESGRADDVVVMVWKPSSPRSNEFRATYQATADELGHIRSAVRSWMALHDLPDATRDDVLIAIGEAVSNIVRHAYPKDMPGKVQLKITRSRDSMESEISDNGRWLDPAEAPGHPGLGLGILKSVAQGLDIERTASGTMVSFKIPIKTSD